MGAAEVGGLQSRGVGACVKHFALNNKETNRKDSDSRASERAWAAGLPAISAGIMTFSREVNSGSR